MPFKDSDELQSMTWDSLAAGLNCPFDLPREEPNDFWESVAELKVSTLCLMKNQAYRGHCILIYDTRHATSPEQLSTAEWTDFSVDAHLAVSALREVCRPDHFNVETLGNQMPHLHWQIIPRYKNDPRWGGPIWMTSPEEMPQAELSAHERKTLVDELRAALARL